MIKKFSYILIFLLLASCGYETIYANKKYKTISINKIIIEGDKKISRKVISLLNLRKNNNQNYSYDLTLISKKKVEPVAKDESGNISVYKTKINVELFLKDPNDQGEIIRQRIFDSSFVYNNIQNKFDLSRYQKNIEKNLIDKIVEEITIYLSFKNDS